MKSLEPLVSAVMANRAQDSWAQRRIAKAVLGSGREQLVVDDSREIGRVAELVLADVKVLLTPISDAILLSLVDAHEILLAPPPPTRGGGVVRDEEFREASLRAERRSAVAWLIEAACRWSTGSQAPTTAVMARVGALARMFQVLLRTRDDAWRLGGMELKITVDRVAPTYVDGGANDIARLMAAGGGSTTFNYMREAEMWMAMKVARNEMEQWNRAVEHDLGWSPALFRILRAEHTSQDYSSARREPAEHVVGRLMIGGAAQEAAEAFVRHLTLSRSDDFDPTLHEHLPHRHGRRLAYGNRLFVEAADGLVWCPAHSETVMTTWFYRSISNRIRDEGLSIANAARALSGRLDDEFNRRIARHLEHQVRGWDFKRNATSVAGSAIANASGTLGDIDILGLSRQRRAVIAIECKRLNPGLGPYETWIEYRKFVEEKGHIAKHAARWRWLEEHRDLLASELEAAPEEIAVHAVIVTSFAVPTAHRSGSVVPIVAWWDLLSWFYDEDSMADGAFHSGALTRHASWTDL